MNKRRLIGFVIILFCLLTATAGIINAARMRQFPFILHENDGTFIAIPVPSNAGIPDSILPINSINGQRITNLFQAQWIIEQLHPDETVMITSVQDDSVYTIAVTADRPARISHIILIIFLGLAFFLLGFMVWRYGGGDTLITAFLRLNLITGGAILLDSRVNTFASPFIHHVYAIGWMVLYGLIPAAFLDFVFRFTMPKRTHTRWRSFLIYVPSFILIGLAGWFFFGLISGSHPGAVIYLTVVSSYGMGVLLAAYFAASILLLGYSWLHASRKEERNYCRWLLWCTFVGAAPYILLHKLPTLWDSSPWLSLDQALVFLIIAPIGWAMAVSSFKLLRIEWTLSRTLIYVASACIVIYAMMIIVTFSGANHPFNSRGSLIGLLVVSAFIAYLSGHSLSRGIRSAVDRLYYGDWYDFRAAVQQLSQQLAGSVAEKDVITILTEKVPDILHIEKAILVIRDKDDLWFLPPQRNTPAAMDFMKALDSLNDLPELSGSQTRPAIGMRGHPLMVWGVAAILPLAHSGRMMGCLLLGRKDSQSPYSNRDFELLSTLSSFAGMAIYNLELQSTIIERESRARAADLAAGVAHEINNALYPLKGQAQLMLHSLSQASLPLPRESLYASAQTMLESAETIQRIANTLNHLSKPIIPNKERLILSDIADEAIRILRDTAGRIKRFQADRPDSPYRIVRDYAEQLPAIEADRAQLIQVFINLIINAADAMESRAEGVLTVGARLSETRDQVVGFVADSGSGIRPELLKKIVQPYFTTKANNQGTGLGLAIVHSIIANHSGSLVISSVVDHGTRVEFALPLPTPSLPRIN